MNKPKPKLRRLKNGYVMRNHRMIPYTELTQDEQDQLELQELAVGSADEQLNEDEIVQELLRIDGKLADIEMSLEKTRSITADKALNMKMTMDVLGRRRALLESLLNKKLPDRKSLAVDANYTFNTKSAEGLPDDVLIAAMSGQLTEKQMEALKLLIQPTIGGTQ